MTTVFCRQCGHAIDDAASICPDCGGNPLGAAAPALAAVPDGVRGWSWGAFFLSWIWAIGNRTWIGLLALVPYLGFVMAIILGIKGREWAWRNARWDSLEHFNRVQRLWSVWGFIVFLALLLFGIAMTVFVPMAFLVEFWRGLPLPGTGVST